MSPKEVIVEVKECEHAVIEQVCTSRGELYIKYVCKHPDHEDCECMNIIPSLEECPFCEEE